MNSLIFIYLDILSIEKVQVIEFIEQNNLVIEFSRFLNINDYPTQLSTEAGWSLYIDVIL